MEFFQKIFGKKETVMIEEIDFGNLNTLDDLVKIISDDQKEFRKSARRLQSNFEDKMDSEMLQINEKILIFSDSMASSIRQIVERIKLDREDNISIHRKIGEGIQTLNSKISNLEKIIDEKNKELTRFNEGFSETLNRNQFKELLNLKRNVNEIEEVENLKAYINDRIDEMFYDNNIVKMPVEIGSKISIRDHKIVETIETDDESLDESIHSVINEGYVSTLYSEHRKTIAFPEVAVYRYVKSEED